MTRRDWILATGAPLLAQKKNVAPPPRPNIVFVLADDLAAWMLGCYGNQEIKTPNIDQLARTGTRFSNHFVCTPICSASRATIFTGRVPRQHGIHDFLSPNPISQPPQGQKEVPASFASEVMLSDILANAGYRCGYVGKWHMGPSDAIGHNYEYSYIMAGQGSSRYQDPPMYLNGKLLEEKGYLASLMTQRAGEYLDRQSKDKPFFLTVSHFNPHTPYEGHPQKYYDMYSKSIFDTFGWERAAPHALREKQFLADPVANIRRCAAATTALDDEVGALVKKLRERGLADNTLIVFCGDNGFLLGRHGLWSKGLASDPINMYEEAVGVPMIWSWPGKVPPESVRPEVISTYDFVPTICDALDLPAPERNLCGRSYAEVAFGKIHGRPAKYTKEKPWSNLVFGHFRNTEMARDNYYKLVLRDGGQGPCELFDLKKDPRERVNQYANPAYTTVRERLTRELSAWREKYSA